MQGRVEQGRVIGHISYKQFDLYTHFYFKVTLHFKSYCFNNLQGTVYEVEKD